MSKARSWATTPEYGIQQARQGIVAIHAMGVSVSQLYSFHMHITYLGLVSCFLHSELPWGSPQGVAGCNLIAVRWQVFFSFLSAFRNHQLVFEGCNHWQLWHSCLLILQEICHFLTLTTSTMIPRTTAVPSGNAIEIPGTTSDLLKWVCIWMRSPMHAVAWEALFLMKSTYLTPGDTLELSGRYIYSFREEDIFLYPSRFFGWSKNQADMRQINRKQSN